MEIWYRRSSAICSYIWSLNCRKVPDLSINLRFWYEIIKGKPNFQGTSNWSYKYCITITGSNTKIPKTHTLLNKMLLSLSALLSVYCDLRFLRLPQRQSFFSSWAQYSTKLPTILKVTGDHSCRTSLPFGFKNVKWFFPS